MLRPKAHCCSDSALGPSLPSTGSTPGSRLGRCGDSACRFASPARCPPCPHVFAGVLIAHMANANACIAERRSCTWASHRHNSHSSRSVQKRGRETLVYTLNMWRPYCRAILTPRRPLGCIFPEVWFKNTEVHGRKSGAQYLQAKPMICYSIRLCDSWLNDWNAALLGAR